MLDLKNIINNLPSAVIVVNGDRRVLIANKMAQAFSGIDEDSLIGLRGGEVMGCVHATESPQGCGHGRACRYCAAKQAVVKSFREKVDIEPFEALIETEKNGALCLKFTVTIVDNPLPGSGQRSKPVAIVTVDDMTAYKKKERMEAVVETVGTICHELNQPLMVLTGQLELMEMDIGANPRFETFREQLQRMSVTTKKLLGVKSYATK
ncbi:MAG: PAS domain-containing protein, partial [Desulfobacterales bacterium]|nr:PAS domain-containing protein [Desulfobacterales bacterium]